MPDIQLKQMLLTPREVELVENSRKSRGHEDDGLLGANQVEGKIHVAPQGAMLITEDPMAMPKAFIPFRGKQVRITIEEIPS